MREADFEIVAYDGGRDAEVAALVLAVQRETGVIVPIEEQPELLDIGAAYRDGGFWLALQSALAYRRLSGASLREVLAAGLAMRRHEKLSRAQMLLAANAPIRQSMVDAAPQQWPRVLHAGLTGSASVGKSPRSRAARRGFSHQYSNHSGDTA